MHVAYASHLLMTGWNGIHAGSLFGEHPNPDALQTHLVYNNRRAMSEVIGSREQAYVLQLQQTFCVVRCFVAPGDAGNGVAVLEAVERNGLVDESVR